MQNVAEWKYILEQQYLTYKVMTIQKSYPIKTINVCTVYL